MLSFKGRKAKDLCDSNLAPSRRELSCESADAACWVCRCRRCWNFKPPVRSEVAGSGPGWGKAKSIIMVYLQGGPSHLDLWDPKENVPDNVKSVFQSDQHQAAGQSSSPKTFPNSAS